MLSSISSSETAELLDEHAASEVPDAVTAVDAAFVGPSLPRRSLLAATATALFGTALASTALESFWRMRGFTPSLRDSAELWCQARERANAAGASALAIIGTSRAQLGIEPAALADALRGRRPIQLAINGRPASVSLLRNLAEDDGFAGAVLCEVMPQSFFLEQQPSAVPWLAYARTRPSVARWEGELRRAVQTRLVSIQPGLDLQVVARRVLKGEGLPRPVAFSVRPDRFIETNFEDKEQRERLLQRWVAAARASRPPPAAELKRVFNDVAACCRRLASRGCRVVFVRMPSSLAVRDIEDEHYPRSEYWERLLQVTGAPGIYDRDISKPEDFVCQEGSHLTSDQARSFSSLLGRELSKRALI